MILDRLTRGVVVLVCPEVALDTGLAGEHDRGPGLACRTPEQHHDSISEGVKVDMPVVIRVRIEADVAKDLSKTIFPQEFVIFADV